MNRRTVRRPLAVVSAAVVSSALLAGCAEEIPAPQAGEPFSGPVLTEEQDVAIIEAVSATLDKADKSRTSADLKARVTGPALEVRKSQLKVAKANDSNEFVTAIPNNSQQMIIPTTNTWPRTSFSITERLENMETPRLVVFEQDTARKPYKMWAWVQLVPGINMPHFADTRIGSEPLAPDDGELLVASPADALAQYADIVSLGTKKSSFADTFDLPDADLVARVQGDAKNVRATPGFDDADGKYTVEFTAREDDVRVVRTADGGALVVGVLDGKSKLTTEEGAEVQAYSKTQETLLGDADPTNKLVVGYTDTVALYVPPKDSGEKVRSLGYSHVATSASN
ncbi:hypothetical protein LEP48_10505 [Isoptericola sp. NEAU-Y5]|uniref:DUF8094 domain-containing protein n=1 Tax=Isoptericola luteus TaxID=2879484 RepID=A0ABS7ZFH3_9MICO|nr:hypothetical protein [Isoptericola sp. NEAU-Y5]MCA5893778.1 hypothetical protein [Isoptericola sp. NEAU-Y5]